MVLQMKGDVFCRSLLMLWCVEVIVQTRALDERIAGFERANRMWQLPKYFCVYYWWGLVS